MNLKVYILTLAIGLVGCNGGTGKVVGDTVKLHELKKLFVVGDFDGDRERDTIFQHNFSQLTKAEIDNSADPFQNEWGTVVKWFYGQNSDVYLTINGNTHDTLHLATAQGLYCLVNIGDNNSDGNDEIAFVVDYCDFSRVNSCKIYSLCNDKWTLLKQFGIDEGSFDFTTSKTPTFDSIRNYLERKNGKWVYKDYLDDEIEKPDNIVEMKKLVIEKCK